MDAHKRGELLKGFDDFNRRSNIASFFKGWSDGNIVQLQEQNELVENKRRLLDI